MRDSLKHAFQLPPEQLAIRDKCIHPSETFVECPIEDIETSIPARFEKIVRMYPDRLAVKMGERSLTYDELNNSANRIARAILEKCGLRSEPITHLFEAGKFYIAVDPSFLGDRFAFILNDSQAGLIVTNDRSVESARRQMIAGHQLLNIDEIDSSVSCENLGLLISPTDLRTLRYTSGSTGEPKGVILRHASLLHDLTLQNQVGIDDRLSLIHSVSFGSSNTHLFYSLLTGASLFPFDIKSEGIEKLARWLVDAEITMLHLPPAAFRQLGNLALEQNALPKLRLIRLSGEAINRGDFDLYKSKFGKHTFLELRMGATEARGIARAIVDHTFSFPEKGTPAGYPLAGTNLLILADNGREVQLGEVGEIAVKGRNLSDGYWRRSDLNNLKFLKEPNDGDEQTYMTGDLGYMRPDGFLIHLGRKDFMVKIRGYRVEIAEVEKALLSHSQVKDAAVAAWDRDSGEKYLAAYVVARGNPKPTVDDLRGFLRGRLPDYMNPSTFVFMDSLPLTNGKLDRIALPLPDHKRPALEQPYVPPQSEIEKGLVQIWEEVLNVRPIGMYDNFFNLGGHSLAASRVISRVIQAFQLELPVKALFDSPTVAEMAAIITQNQTKRASDAELAQMLRDVEAMTEEEAQRQLVKESVES